MFKVLLFAIGFFSISAALLALSGIFGQMALDNWAKWKNYIDYKYSYVSKQHLEIRPDDPEQAQYFLNHVDLGKRNADNSLEKAFQGTKDLERLRQINDYTFKIFRDLWFAQKSWLTRNGRYFQGKVTMPQPPHNLSNQPIEHRFGLSDQVDDWLDIGYEEQYAPVQLECHVYNGPKGHGYTILAKFLYEGQVWTNQMHVGSERSRDAGNFTWSKTS